MSFSHPSLAPQLQLSSVAFFGRTFAEYLDLFGLDPKGLATQRVLDVAAGPSSFTAEATTAGIDATAVDPLYGQPVESLRTHVQLDYARMFEQVRRNASLFRFHRFPTIEAAEADRRGAAERFLADYEFGFIHGRYVGAALPKLPFPDQSFDLVLCAHLLFVYRNSFDFAWHLAACRELARVCSGGVKIHPLCGLDGQIYPELGRLRTELDRQGVASELVSGGAPFFGGASESNSLQLLGGVA